MHCAPQTLHAYINLASHTQIKNNNTKPQNILKGVS